MQLYIISILTNKLFDVSGDLTEVGDNGMLLSGELRNLRKIANDHVQTKLMQEFAGAIMFFYGGGKDMTKEGTRNPKNS